MNNFPQPFSNQVGHPMNSQHNSMQPLIFNPLSDWTNQPHLHSYLLGNLGRRIQHHPVAVPPPPPPVRTPTQSDRISISLVCASLLSKAFLAIKQKEKKESIPRLFRPLPQIGLPCEGMEDEYDEMPYLLPFTPVQQLHIDVSFNFRYFFDFRPRLFSQSIPYILHMQSGYCLSQKSKKFQTFFIHPHPISNDLLIVDPSHPSPDSSSLPTISANRLVNLTSSEGHESDQDSDKSVIYVCTQKRSLEITIDGEEDGKMEEGEQKDSDDEDECESEDEEESDDEDNTSSPEPSSSQKDVHLLSHRGYEWRRPSALVASSQITMTLKREDENEKVEKEEKRFKRVMKRSAASYAKKQAKAMKRRKINKHIKIMEKVQHPIVEMVVKERNVKKKGDDEIGDSEDEDVDIMG